MEYPNYVPMELFFMRSGWNRLDLFGSYVKLCLEPDLTKLVTNFNPCLLHKPSSVGPWRVFKCTHPGTIDTYSGSYPACHSGDIINSILGFVTDVLKRDLLLLKVIQFFDAHHPIVQTRPAIICQQLANYLSLTTTTRNANRSTDDWKGLGAISHGIYREKIYHKLLFAHYHFSLPLLIYSTCGRISNFINYTRIIIPIYSPPTFRET
jgi:hypothetical protein